LEYTITGIRVLGLSVYLRLSAAYYYSGSFKVAVTIGEQHLGLELEFTAYRSGPTSGGALITILDKEVLNIDPIPLFSIGPLTLELKPGLRLLSKLGLSASDEQVYLALRNEIHIFAEVTISTPCIIVIKFKLGVKVSGKIMRREHQFGFFSPDQGAGNPPLPLPLALLNGDACMEVRYMQLPFQITVQPICRVCVGFWRCRRCYSCLTSLLSSLTLYMNFGSLTTDIIYTSCNNYAVFTPYPPSPPPLPLPPPSPPEMPWTVNCWGNACNDDAECTNLGWTWTCSPLFPVDADDGFFDAYGLGRCYDTNCQVPPGTVAPRPPSVPKPPTNG